MNTLLQRFGAQLRPAMWRLLPLAGAALLATGVQANVVISQVYGGGGNAGATLQRDFIELFNKGNAAITIGGWSVQYTSANGNTWQVTAIPAGTTLAPGQYYLVAQAAGAGGTVPVVGDITGAIAMAGANGKVALASSTTPLTTTNPVSAALQDIVSYGASTPTEGTPTGALSNTTAAVRKAGGCTDTNDNSQDFTVEAPAPRNSSSPLNTNCSAGPGPAEPLALTIPQIQGSAAISPVAGQRVVTSGVVTLRTSNGFFIQDAAGDGNPETSDGIFVFTSSTPPVAASVGSLVSVTGNVVEFSNGAGTAPTPLTQIASVTNVSALGTGTTILPTAVSLPVPAGQTLERYEGMLVAIQGPLTVQQNFFQARFGQITLGAGRHETPTNRFRPGPQAQALDDLQARSRLLLDDASSFQNPNPTPYFAPNGLPRGGDQVSNLVGVLDFGLATASSSGPGLYRLQPVQAPQFVATNPRNPAPPAVGGNLRLGAMNVLNYFTTFTNGQNVFGQTGQGCSVGASVTAGNCRGANNLEEFLRQEAKIVAALAALDADAVGLIEIQNNGNVAAQRLVDQLNAAVGAGTYAVAPLPAAGTGTDAIRLAAIYKPARLAVAGPALSDPDPVNNRPTLAQPFVAPNGEVFSLVVNHLKSKGSCPAANDPDAEGNVDAGDGQGCWNLARLQQAQRLRTFVAQVQAASGSPHALLVGDMNAYGQEDPIFELTSNGYVDQKLRTNAFAYGYVFDGMAGRLDHAIASTAMSPRVVAARAWHINADEQVSYDYNLEFKAPLTTCNGLCPPDPFAPDAFRSSDHDPVLVGVDWYKPIVPTVPRGLLIGTPGADRFVFSSLLQAGGSISGFQPGTDQIDLRAILASLGRAAVADPIGTGYIGCATSRAGAAISVDTDGAAGPQAPRALVQLIGQACSTALQPQNFVVR
jgi:predicted extracellular nuclease